MFGGDCTFLPSNLWILAFTLITVSKGLTLSSNVLPVSVTIDISIGACWTETEEWSVITMYNIIQAFLLSNIHLSKLINLFTLFKRCIRYTN